MQITVLASTLASPGFEFASVLPLCSSGRRVVSNVFSALALVMQILNSSMLLLLASTSDF